MSDIFESDSDESDIEDEYDSETDAMDVDDGGVSVLTLPHLSQIPQNNETSRDEKEEKSSPRLRTEKHLLC